jgi:hypothetical protein
MGAARDAARDAEPGGASHPVRGNRDGLRPAVRPPHPRAARAASAGRSVAPLAPVAAVRVGPVPGLPRARRTRRAVAIESSSELGTKGPVFLIEALLAPSVSAESTESESASPGVRSARGGSRPIRPIGDHHGPIRPIGDHPAWPHEGRRPVAFPVANAPTSPRGSRPPAGPADLESPHPIRSADATGAEGPIL